MKISNWLFGMATCLILATGMPKKGTAQRSPVADYLGNYYEMLNNYGDASLSLSDRQLFREEILTQYFLFEGSLVWNDLRPQGSRYIQPREYLDNILTDFPKGIAFSHELIDIGDLQTAANGLKTVVRLRVSARPVGGRAITNELSIVLAVQQYSTSSISARIKSIDKAGPGASTSVQPEPEQQNAAPTAAEQESRVWQQALSTDRISGYEGYLSAYPSGLHASEARHRIGELRDEATWSEAKRRDTESSYESYLRGFSDGAHAREARSRLEELRKPALPAAIQELEQNMVHVEGGSFKMGCTGEQGSDCLSSEKPAHRVELSSFSIGKYEVTQAQWKAVMGSNPSHFSSCGNCPVENVSWNDVQDFIDKLNRMTGGNYRLPTEAEWEYAARGGSRSRGHKYSGSDNLGNVGWYDGNSSERTHPIGQKIPNELGIYDMSGSVREWCSDRFGRDYYGNSPSRNPQGPNGGSYRVYRGGSWNYIGKYCRTSFRNYRSQSDKDLSLGFRLAAP